MLMLTMRNVNSNPLFPKQQWKHHGGFTLVEIAISLLIIGLVVTGLISSATILMQQAQQRESRDTLNVTKQRIVGFALSEQRLPVYASGAGSDELTPIGASARDFWNRKINYIYDTELARSDTQKIICSKKSTNILAQYCSDAACTAPSTQNNIAFILFSTGKNLINQTGAATTPHTESGTDPSISGPDGAADSIKTITIFETGSPVGNYLSPAVNATANDDLVAVVTLDELRERLACTGAPLRIINSELPMGAAGATYTAAVYAEGGVPVASSGKYRWCVESSVAADLGIIATIEAAIVSPASTNSITVGAIGSCSAANEDATTWVQGDMLSIKGAAATPANSLNTSHAGTYEFVVYLRDNEHNTALPLSSTDPQDNITSRTFVLAIHGS